MSFHIAYFKTNFDFYCYCLSCSSECETEISHLLEKVTQCFEVIRKTPAQKKRGESKEIFGEEIGGNIRYFEESDIAGKKKLHVFFVTHFLKLNSLILKSYSILTFIGV